MQIIGPQHFTALPAGDSSKFLAYEFRKLLILNITGYLKSIQSSIPTVDISHILEKYQKVDTTKNFSPTIYSAFTRLVLNSASGNLVSILDVINKLNIIADSEIYNSKFSISGILTEDWEVDFVNKIRSEKISAVNSNLPVVFPILDLNISELENSIFNSLSLLQSIDFDFFQEIDSYLTRIKLFVGKGISASTSASAFGAIFLATPKTSENSDYYFTEHIVHETSHLQLEILHAVDKLVLNNDSERFKSPVRTDPRPIIGIFHATFVLSRMVRVFKRIIKDSGSNSHIRESLDLFLRQFDEGLEAIEKNAKLTEYGNLIKQSLPLAAEI